MPYFIRPHRCCECSNLIQSRFVGQIEIECVHPQASYTKLFLELYRKNELGLLVTLEFIYGGIEIHLLR